MHCAVLCAGVQLSQVFQGFGNGIFQYLNYKHDHMCRHYWLTGSIFITRFRDSETYMLLFQAVRGVPVTVIQGSLQRSQYPQRTFFVIATSVFLLYK